MKNYTLAEINISIPYLPALRPYIGSIAACILMQQLDYWFATKNGAPFYKFLAAQKGAKPHPAYKPGDSWCEELSISPDEFRCAFDKIGYRYKSYTEYKLARKSGNPFQGRFYASYHDKINGLSWYLRNHDLVDALLFKIFTRKSGKSILVNRYSQATDIKKANLPKQAKPIPNITEITTEITAGKTTTDDVRLLLSETTLSKISDQELQGLAKRHGFDRLLQASDVAAETWRRDREERHNPGGYLQSLCASLVMPNWYIPYGDRKAQAEASQQRKAEAEAKEAGRKMQEEAQSAARNALWAALSEEHQEKYLAAARDDLPEELKPPIAVLAMAKILAWEASQP